MSVLLFLKIFYSPSEGTLFIPQTQLLIISPQIALKIISPWDLFSAILNIVTDLAVMGETEQAKKLVHKIQLHNKKVLLLNAIASAQAMQRNLPGALETWKEAKKEAIWAGNIFAYPQYLALWRRNRDRHFVRRPDCKKNKAEALRDIARSQAQAQVVKKAKETAREIEDVDYRTEAFRMIAEEQVGRKEFDEAKITASQMENSFNKALAWIAIAKRCGSRWNS